MQEEKKGMPGWLKGCLTGCAVILVLVLILITFVCQQCKQMFQGVIQAEQSHEELVRELGDYDEYVPGARMSVTADQMERFLRIRESMAGDRADLEEVFRNFDLDESLKTESTPRKIMKVLNAIGGLVNPAGEYIGVRNRKLLEERMPVGEYTWIYALTYYSWLGHDITAGPKLKIEGESRELFRDSDSPFSPREQYRRYRKVVDGMFRNQIGNLPEGDSVRREELERELVRFENSPRAILWESGLPEVDTMILEPYRDRLEATWHPPTNLMEMPLPEDNRTIRID